MKNTSQFQLVLIGIFVILAVAGIGTFAVYKGASSKDAISATIWGTLDGAKMNAFIAEVTKGRKPEMRLMYVQKGKDTIAEDLVEALAIGQAPDAILVDNANLLRNANKIITIPYASYPQSQYKSTYVQEAEMYLTETGVIAVPFAVDPLVMYWNRDIFNDAVIPEPPKYWDEFVTLAPKLTVKNQSLGIERSAVALGEFRNVNNAKQILSMLIMQAGNPIAVRSSGRVESALTNAFGYPVPPANSALSFYTQFANPSQTVYTWNRSMSGNAETLFRKGLVAMYFGFASELPVLREKNPNLNFGVALMPQTRPSGTYRPVQMTYGTMYGFSITRGTRNFAGTLSAIYALTDASALKKWGTLDGSPSVRRDVLAANPADAASAVFATSALWSRGWLEPDTQKTSIVFQSMVENVTSGILRHNDAVRVADDELNRIYQGISY